MCSIYLCVFEILFYHFPRTARSLFAIFIAVAFMVPHK